MPSALQWDIFCRVIDNHGDLGVCWRLAADLAERGHRIRLWVDDASALAWMAPQGHPGVQVHGWPDAQDSLPAFTPPTDVLVEAFGCDIPGPFLDTLVRNERRPSWLNLEYLSAEGYVERSHLLPSPVMSGPAKGWNKVFFYPGFTPKTGGLIREQHLPQRQQRFDRGAWLRAQGVAASQASFVASLFCYEPPALPALLDTWRLHGHHGRPVDLLVTAGRATAAVRQVLPGSSGHLRLHFLPYLSQAGFDDLLWACDLNLVRGEDSLVRALWAGKPLVWHLYPQDDGAHGPKLDAFLAVTGATDTSCGWHRAWNPTPGTPPEPFPAYPSPQEWAAWQAQALALRQQLQAQEDLAGQLLRCVDKSR